MAIKTNFKMHFYPVGILLILSVVFVLIPYMYSILIPTPGMVFSPLGSPLKDIHSFDNYHAMSAMREIKDGHFIVNDPATWEGKKFLAFNYLTYQTSVWLSALCWLATDSSIVFYVMNRVLFLFFFGLIIYFFLYTLSRESKLSLLFSIFFCFFSYHLYRVNDIYAFLNSIINPLKLIRWIIEPFRCDAFGLQTFISRFFHPSISGPITLFSYYITYLFINRDWRRYSIALAIVVVLMQYVYIPAALLFDVFLCFLLVHFILKKDYRRFRILVYCIATAIIAGIPLIFGYIGTEGAVTNISANNDLALYFAPRDFVNDIKMTVKYMVTYGWWLIIFYLSNKKRRELQSFFLLIGLAIFSMSLTDLIFGTEVAYRFHERGVRYLLAFMLLATILVNKEAIKSGIIKMLSFVKREFFRNSGFKVFKNKMGLIKKFVKPVLIGVFIIYVGFLLNYWGIKFAKADFYKIEHSKIELSNWLNNNTERDSVIATIDYELSFILPSLTHNNVLIPPLGQKNITAKDTRRRFMLILKLFGFDKDKFSGIVKSGEARRRYYEWADNPYNILDRVGFSFWYNTMDAQIAWEVKKFRYDGRFYGVLMNEFAETDLSEIHDYRIDYIIITKSEMPVIGEEFFRKRDIDDVVYQNRDYTVYSR